jgi:hypothetical protein
MLELIKTLLMYGHIIEEQYALGTPGRLREEYGDWPMYAYATTKFFGFPWYIIVVLIPKHHGQPKQLFAVLEDCCSCNKPPVL